MPTRLDEILGPDQVRLLAAYLAVCCEYGHGQVVLQVKQGIPRFIELHLAEVLERSPDQSRLAKLVSGKQ